MSQGHYCIFDKPAAFMSSALKPLMLILFAYRNASILWFSYAVTTTCSDQGLNSFFFKLQEKLHINNAMEGT